MTSAGGQHVTSSVNAGAAAAERPPAAGLAAMVKLLRPHQWVKGAFVLVGPFYGGVLGHLAPATAVACALVSFSLASSLSYIVNDLADVEADRLHPRKRRRPIASGAVSMTQAKVLAGVCLVGAAVACLGVAVLPGLVTGLVKGGQVAPNAGQALAWTAAAWTGAAVGAYLLNTVLYSLVFKHRPIADVLSLAMGFVLRVLAGCAAASVVPSTFLLNCTLFLAMYLAFGKRLGERRTMGNIEDAAKVRAVQSQYTDDLLRMLVVVTAVALLVAYTEYVQAMADKYTVGFNLLWLTVLPAVYAMLRSIMLLENGKYDDPTELAVKDRPFQVAGLLFMLLTGAAMLVALKR